MRTANCFTVLYFFFVLCDNVEEVDYMFSDIKIDKSTPVYIQLGNYMKGLILKGMFRNEEKLPSTRELSSMLSLSRNTVNCAYERLQDEGLINIIEGKGAYISHISTPRELIWDMD